MVRLTPVSIASPVYRKLPNAPPHWGLRALNLPCHSHWEIQVLERPSYLFYVANYSSTGRDSQLQTQGFTWGMWSQLPIDKKTEQNPDSWTSELLLLTGWDLALGCNNYYRQWIGRREKGIEKNTIKHSKWEERGLNAEQCWKYLIHRLMVIKLRENIEVTCSFSISQERKIQWLAGVGTPEKPTALCSPVAEPGSSSPMLWFYILLREPKPSPDV